MEDQARKLLGANLKIPADDADHGLEVDSGSGARCGPARYLLTTPAMGWRSTAEADRAAGPLELPLLEEVIAPRPTADGAYDYSC